MGREVSTSLFYRPEGRVAHPATDRGFAVGRRTDSHPLSHICRAGARAPAPDPAALGCACPLLSRASCVSHGWAGHLPQRLEMKGGGCKHQRNRGDCLIKEHTANSLLIIQTSGLALSSSWGCKQEAQLRMLGAGRRCLPEPGGPASPPWATSCTWSMSPDAPEDRRWFRCCKHSAHPF